MAQRHSKQPVDYKGSLNTAQQIVALDARYNACRPLPHQHKLQYLRRRNQLLQENAKHAEDPLIRRRYLRLRAQVLCGRYGPLDKKSNRSSSRISSSRHSLHLSRESLSKPTDSRNSSFLSPGGLVPTRKAQASRAMAGDASLSEHYAFCGMDHIFDKHSDAVTTIRFANNDKELLACASRDGNLSVFSLLSHPPSLSCVLRGHTRAVNDFDWSVSNDFIVSASSDGSCRLWEAGSGACLREIEDSSGARSLSCRFHPHNNNIITLGNSKGQVRVFNVSTGKAVKGGGAKCVGAALSLTFDSSGSILWVGDSKGSIFSYGLDLVSGKLQRLKRIIVSPGCMLTSLSYRTWVNREARDPSLLVSCTDSTLRLFRILMDGGVYVKSVFSLPHSSHHIHSAFCPLMSFLQGACVVSGGEDGSVYFFDVESGALVNKLQGHSSPVLCVCWAYDESILASCDSEGTVILWKREQKSVPKSNETNQ